MRLDDVAAVLQVLPGPALVLDDVASVLACNRAAAERFGCSPSDLIGAQLEVLAPSDAAASLVHSPEAAQPAFSSSTRQVVLRHPGKGGRLSLASTREVELEERRASIALLQADAAFEEAARVRELQETALALRRIGLFEHDHVTGVIHSSPILGEIYGFSPGEPLTLDGLMASLLDERDDIITRMARAHDPAGDGKYDVTHRIRRRDGTLLWVHARSLTVFGEIEGQRRPLRTLGSIMDVTERKAEEGELMRRSAILDATPDFVSITDLKGNVLFANKAARDFMGLAAGAPLEGCNMAPLHSEKSSRLILSEGIPTAIREGYWKGEMEFVRHDGKVVLMSEVLISHRGDDGQIAYLSTVSRDLSRERELEDQFRQAQKMEAIGRLAGGVAHDFNNLLSAILGFTSMALDDLEPGHGARPGLEQALRAAERAAALTQQLLAFGRKQILQPRVLDLRHCIHEMSAMIHRLVGETIRIVFLHAPHPVKTRADPNQIQQALLNLIVNARDAMADGGVLTIETQRVILDDLAAASKLELTPGPYAVIAVSDTGQGMTPEVRARAFEPFFTTKGPGEGTGLGLSTVFGIVRQSGGSIFLYSEPGHGTTFKLYFPSTEECVVVPSPLAGPSQTSGGEVVLVAEDDAEARAMVTTVLERTGYRVLVAPDPATALKLAASHAGDIDLLLTDMQMPGMNGRELARRLVEQRPGISVLYISGYTEDSIVHQGVLETGIDFLAKPLTPNSLLAAVQRVLAQRADPKRR